MSQGPLSDIKVVDLTQQIAGPYATKLLADYGSEVITVEPPEGDPTPEWAPFLGMCLTPRRAAPSST